MSHWNIFIRKYYVFKGVRAKSKLLFNVFKVLLPKSDINLKNIKQNLTFRTKTLKNVWFSVNFEPWAYFFIKKLYVFKGFRAKSKLLFNVFKVLPPESDRNLKNIK